MLDQTKDREDAAATDGAVASQPRNPAHTEIPVHKVSDLDHQEADDGSLIGDVSALYEDGKTYVSSELAFQKTRARYTAKKGSKVAIFGIGALALANLALIGLTVGAILSLETLVGPLAATLIVTIALLIGAAILGYMAKNKVAEISRVFSGGQP